MFQGPELKFFTSHFILIIITIRITQFTDETHWDINFSKVRELVAMEDPEMKSSFINQG